MTARIPFITLAAAWLRRQRADDGLVRHGAGPRGDVVIAVDHPGTNGRDPMTMAGGLLVWDRAVDLRVALDTAEAFFASHL